MKKSRRCSRLSNGVGTAFILVSSAFGFEPDEFADISESGRIRTFELVQDQVAVKEGGKRTLTQAPTGAGAPKNILKAAEAQRAKLNSEGKTTAVVELILTEKGRPATPLNMRYVTGRIVAKLKEGTDAKTLASQLRMRLVDQPAYAPGWVILDAGGSEAALDAAVTIRERAEVEQADAELAKLYRKSGLVPNDPLFPQQWHLRNTTQGGGALWADARLTEAWEMATGSGVTIAIIDDGVEYTHPDLDDHYNDVLDYDFNDADEMPLPVVLTGDDADAHGTACAGVAAGAGQNGVGITGAAFDAELTAMRLIAAPFSDATKAEAFARRNDAIEIKSNSWVGAFGDSLEGPGPLAEAALLDGVTNGRGGKGVIYLFAAGNNLEFADNVNYDGHGSSPYTIAVGALSDSGMQAGYSEPGACLIVTAPSSSGRRTQEITTTDLTGDSGYNSAASVGNLTDTNYTNDHGGTSSSCPLVAGVCALMLEENPALGWRDVQEILLRTARKVHHTDPEWQTNAAGLSFNHKYGSGLVDAEAAVRMASSWANLATPTAITNTNSTVEALPNNLPAGLSRSFNVTGPAIRVEHVEVTIQATHDYIGEMRIELTSPSGMKSILAEPHYDPGTSMDWTFTSVRHWGELSTGIWQVTISDYGDSNVGTLQSVTLNLRGVSAGAAPLIVPAGLTLISESNLPANGVADPGEIITCDFALKNLGSSASPPITGSLVQTSAVDLTSDPLSFGSIPAGGTVSRSFTFRAVGINGGSERPVLQLSGLAEFAYAGFDLMFGTASTQIFNGSSITLLDQSVADPSPAVITVSNLTGVLQRTEVTLNHFAHSYPYDMTISLSSPSTVNVVLFDDSTTESVSDGRDLTFADDGFGLPEFDSSLPSGTYRPYSYYDLRSTDLPASHAWGYLFTEYNGLTPNGEWQLYAEDLGAGDSGTINSWSISLTTVDCTDNAYIPPQRGLATAAESAGVVQVRVARSGGRAGTATVLYATNNGSATAGSDYTPTSGALIFAPGELEKTIDIPLLADSLVEGTETFSLDLQSVSGESQLGSAISQLVTILDVPPLGYLGWAATQDFGPGAQSAVLDDPNGDGITNLAAYAFNLLAFNERAFVLTPTTGLAGLPHIDHTGARLRIEFLRRKASTSSGLTYRPQFGSALASGQPGSFADAGGTPTVESINSTWERVVIEDTVSGASRRFGRLLVEYTTPPP